MVTTYGDFPGVQVSVAGGGITAVAIGDDEKLVIFGEPDYARDEPDFDTISDGSEDALDTDLAGSLETPEQINSRRDANTLFGDDSELANAMREALANGANIDFLYGVAPRRFNVVGEIKTSQSGNLEQDTVWEEDVQDEANISAIRVTDNETGTELEVRYDYNSPPDVPTDTDVVNINPLTGEYEADADPDGTTSEYAFDYKYVDWSSAFSVNAVTNVVNEEETAVFDVTSDSDNVSVSLESAKNSLRDNYQLVNGLSGAEPNSSEEILDGDGNYLRRDARYETNNFTQNSVNSDSYFKVAPVRKENTPETVLGAVGGLFAGNPITDPIFNDPVTFSGDLEENFTKTEAEEMRNQQVIPIRQAGSVRVKDNISTSTETDWKRDFWRRRIVDRVILIAKTIGDTIIGRINDEQTRGAAGRLIRAELRELVDDRLLQPNTDSEQRWFVDVSQDPTDSDKVNIDIGITPFGIVKRVDTSITINT